MADLALRHGLVANELRGPMESGVIGDASTEGDSAHSSSAAPAGTANLHAIGRLLDPCVCALLRHVGSVLIEIGSAPRGCSSGDDDERGEMGGVSGVGNSAVERG